MSVTVPFLDTRRSVGAAVFLTPDYLDHSDPGEVTTPRPTRPAILGPPHHPTRARASSAPCRAPRLHGLSPARADSPHARPKK